MPAGRAAGVDSRELHQPDCISSRYPVAWEKGVLSFSTADISSRRARFCSASKPVSRSSSWRCSRVSLRDLSWMVLMTNCKASSLSTLSIIDPATSRSRSSASTGGVGQSSGPRSDRVGHTWRLSSCRGTPSFRQFWLAYVLFSSSALSSETKSGSSVGGGTGVRKLSASAASAGCSIKYPIKVQIGKATPAIHHSSKLQYHEHSNHPDRSGQKTKQDPADISPAMTTVIAFCKVPPCINCELRATQ